MVIGCASAGFSLTNALEDDCKIAQADQATAKQIISQLSREKGIPPIPDDHQSPPIPKMVIGCASAGFSLHPCAIDLTVQTGNCWVGGCPNGWVWVGKMEMCVGMLFEHFFSLASRDLPKHTTLKSYALRRDFCSKSFPLGKTQPEHHPALAPSMEQRAPPTNQVLPNCSPN